MLQSPQLQNTYQKYYQLLYNKIKSAFHCQCQKNDKLYLVLLWDTKMNMKEEAKFGIRLMPGLVKEGSNLTRMGTTGLNLSLKARSGSFMSDIFGLSSCILQMSFGLMNIDTLSCKISYQTPSRFDKLALLDHSQIPYIHQTIDQAKQWPKSLVKQKQVKTVQQIFDKYKQSSKPSQQSQRFRLHQQEQVRKKLFPQFQVPIVWSTNYSKTIIHQSIHKQSLLLGLNLLGALGLHQMMRKICKGLTFFLFIF